MTETQRIASLDLESAGSRAGSIGKEVFHTHLRLIGEDGQEVPLATIFRGIWPFWLAMLLCLAILVAFPELALFLPKRMF